MTRSKQIEPGKVAVNQRKAYRFMKRIKRDTNFSIDPVSSCYFHLVLRRKTTLAKKLFRRCSAFQVVRHFFAALAIDSVAAMGQDSSKVKQEPEVLGPQPPAAFSAPALAGPSGANGANHHHREQSRAAVEMVELAGGP